MREIGQYPPDAPVAYFCLYDNIIEISGSAPIDYDGTTCSPSCSALPHTYIISPGVYCFQNKEFQLQQEGLYRFFMPHVETQQRIVFAGNNNSFASVMTLVSGVAWSVQHGNSDCRGCGAAPLSGNWTNLETIIMQRKISLLCGTTAGFAQHLLKKVGIASRLVHVATLVQPW
jgi:hypothetical protein